MPYINPTTGKPVKLGKNATAQLELLAKTGTRFGPFRVEGHSYLEKLGFITIMPIAGNPFNRLYTITPKGQQYLRERD